MIHGNSVPVYQIRDGFSPDNYGDKVGLAAHMPRGWLLRCIRTAGRQAVAFIARCGALGCGVTLPYSA